MATSAEWHEDYDKMSEASRNFSRAIKSERAEQTSDEQLKKILEHNRDEEIEHAVMALEWLGRCTPKFDEHMKTYLFTTGDILEIEEKA